MIGSRSRAAIALSLVCVALPACSSDAAPEPEPTLDTPGAFVAVEEGPGDYSLLRTLDYYDFGPDTLLFFTEYDVRPTSWQEARAIAMSHQIPVRHPVVAASAGLFSASRYSVVWWRSITKEEREPLD